MSHSKTLFQVLQSNYNGDWNIKGVLIVLISALPCITRQAWWSRDRHVIFCANNVNLNFTLENAIRLDYITCRGFLI